ncbi:glycosyltransferase family 2 protein [Acinetobacter brisouii]
MILVSVIIPSAGRRSALLQRAIKSALVNDDVITTEIIVVLNGKDGITFDTTVSFQHPLVKYYKLEEGNVSRARNYGLSIADGDLIRFLDDDDYLIPEVAYQQYIELYNSDADLSTYAGAIEDDIRRYQVIKPIDIDDYCAATLSAYCPALTFATSYKNKVIKNLRWDENTSITEDEDWMRSIAASQEVKWIKDNNVVAVWYQHNFERLSFSIGHPVYYKNRCISILKTIDVLKKKNRFSKNLQHISAAGLWSAVHGGFHFNPIYWTKIAYLAKKYDKNSRPDYALFYKLYYINPIIIEWILIPYRWASRIFRRMRLFFFKNRYNIRKLRE